MATQDVLGAVSDIACANARLSFFPWVYARFAMFMSRVEPRDFSMPFAEGWLLGYAASVDRMEADEVGGDSFGMERMLAFTGPLDAESLMRTRSFATSILCKRVNADVASSAIVGYAFGARQGVTDDVSGMVGNLAAGDAKRCAFLREVRRHVQTGIARLHMDEVVDTVALDAVKRPIERMCLAWAVLPSGRHHDKLSLPALDGFASRVVSRAVEGRHLVGKRDVRVFTTAGVDAETVHACAFAHGVTVSDRACRRVVEAFGGTGELSSLVARAVGFDTVDPIASRVPVL